LTIYIIFIIGFIFLIKGADWLVEGSSALARRFGIPSIIIGLTVVAFSTSLPEMVVNVFSALEGNTDIALGNVIGSNLANILLILGLTSAIMPLNVKKATAWKEIPFSLVAILVLFVMSNDKSIDNMKWSVLTASDGILLLFFFGFFLYYVIKMALGNREKTADENGKPQVPPWKIVLFLAGGITGLYFGGKWVVNSAVTIARTFGLSDYLISATIIAFGTSSPELITSIVAAVKKEPDLSVGNVVGSNIFNVLLVLGVTSIIKPIPVNPGINYDLIFNMLVNLYLFLFLFIGEKYQLKRWQGFFMVALYVMYILYVILRG